MVCVYSLIECELHRRQREVCLPRTGTFLASMSRSPSQLAPSFVKIYVLPSNLLPCLLHHHSTAELIPQLSSITQDRSIQPISPTMSDKCIVLGDNSAQKGPNLVTAIATRLHAEGVPNVLFDDFAFGLYGVPVRFKVLVLYCRPRAMITYTALF